MSTPNISSRLPSSSSGAADTQSQNPVDQEVTRSDTPKGLLVMVAGQSTKGPLEPVVLETLADAERIYGSGPLVDDIELVLRGARTGASATGNQLRGHVMALRTDTGTAASAEVLDGGSLVMEIQTAASGADGNSWQVDFGQNQAIINDPETGTTYTFPYGAGTLNSDLNTPSDFAQAVTNFTNGRLQVEVVRGSAHFEMSLFASSVGGPILTSSAADETKLDFTGVSADVMRDATNSTHVVGNDDPHFKTGGGSARPVHNYLLPEDPDFERYYAVTAGAPTLLEKGAARHPIVKLGDSSRLDVPTDSLLNLHTANTNTGDAANNIPLQDVGSRDGGRVSEGWMQIRDEHVGRLDLQNTDEVGADFHVNYATMDSSLPFGDSAPQSSIEIDVAGSVQTLAAGDTVFVYGTTEDGIYAVMEQTAPTVYYLELQNTIQKGQTVHVSSTDTYHKYDVENVVEGVDPDRFVEPQFDSDYAVEGKSNVDFLRLKAEEDEYVFVYGSEDPEADDGVYKIKRTSPDKPGPDLYNGQLSYNGTVNGIKNAAGAPADANLDVSGFEIGDIVFVHETSDAEGLYEIVPDDSVKLPDAPETAVQPDYVKELADTSEVIEWTTKPALDGTETVFVHYTSPAVGQDKLYFIEGPELYEQDPSSTDVPVDHVADAGGGAVAGVDVNDTSTYASGENVAVHNTDAASDDGLYPIIEQLVPENTPTDSFTADHLFAIADPTDEAGIESNFDFAAAGASHGETLLAHDPSAATSELYDVELILPASGLPALDAGGAADVSTVSVPAGAIDGDKYFIYNTDVDEDEGVYTVNSGVFDPEALGALANTIIAKGDFAPASRSIGDWVLVEDDDAVYTVEVGLVNPTSKAPVVGTFDAGGGPTSDLVLTGVNVGDDIFVYDTGGSDGIYTVTTQLVLDSTTPEFTFDYFKGVTGLNVDISLASEDPAIDATETVFVVVDDSTNTLKGTLYDIGSDTSAPNADPALDLKEQATYPSIDAMIDAGSGAVPTSVDANLYDADDRVLVYNSTANAGIYVVAPDPKPELGSPVVSLPAPPTYVVQAPTYDDVDLSSQTNVMDGSESVFVHATESDEGQLFDVVADKSGLELSNYRSVAETRLKTSTVEVLTSDGDLDAGYYVYSVQLATAESAEVVKFSFPAPHGIADGGPLATAYESWKGGVSAGQLSDDRLTPTGVQKFEDQYATPQPNSPVGIKVSLAPIISPNSPSEYTGDLQAVWDDGVLHLYFDKEEVLDHDESLIYVDYDTCITDLREVGDLSQARDITDYTVDEQSVVFGATLPHNMIVRPLRITQYSRGDAMLIERRVSSNSNVLHFPMRGEQPGAEGGAISDIETIVGLEYEFEPNFPTDRAVGLTGGALGMDASPEVRATALENALLEYGKRDHNLIVASGLHVDEMVDARDPMTGERVSRPVGVLDVLRRHQSRMASTGASPVVFASLKPMQPSTVSGRYTDRQKMARAAEITQAPPAGQVNTYSVIQRQSMPEAFIFDAPIRQAGQVREAAPFFAGLRSTLGNETTLYDVPTGLDVAYRYDVAGQQLTGRLSEARVNAWSHLRRDTRLADDRTAADPVADQNWRSGIALMAAKEFQQEGVSTLRNLLGALPSGGIAVLRASVESMLRGIAQRVTGIQRLEFNAQTDIKFDVKDGSTLGMRVTPTVVTNGELRSIELSVNARADFGGISGGGGGETGGPAGIAQAQ